MSAAEKLMIILRSLVLAFGRDLLTSWLLLLILLLGGVLFFAHPLAFSIAYQISMHGQDQVLVDDGLMVAANLSGSEPFEELNRKLAGGDMGERELRHFEDIRVKLELAQLCLLCLLPPLFLLIRGGSCAWRRLSISCGLWLSFFGLVSCIWSLLHFRHFFRTLHWWVFQDDSWILPQGCYTLVMYPYAVWKLLGVLLVVWAVAWLLLIHLAASRFSTTAQVGSESPERGNSLSRS